MSRSRSRSPARWGGDGNGDSAPPNNQGPPKSDGGMAGGEEAKLYVGNLSYGASINPWSVEVPTDATRTKVLHRTVICSIMIS